MAAVETIYDKLSTERKKLQSQGHIPEWFTTGGWQMFQENYLHKAVGLRDTYQRIAETAANNLPLNTGQKILWQSRFFDLLWKGWLAASTPVFNMGTVKGMPVSCSGSIIMDSIESFYEQYKETALLTKSGFGTSGYLGDIRPRGAPISSGGKASGVMDVITSFVDDMKKVSQGEARRGAFAGYLPIDHGDFHEVVDYLEHYPDGLNMGWVVTDEFIARLEAGDEDAEYSLQRAMKVKAVTGKGYFFFVDKVNRKRPQMYVDLGLYVKASNLCTEITLFSDAQHTFTCVLSSMNLAKYDEWKDTDAVFTATVFLDCVASEFIKLAKNQVGFEKAVRFTEKSRALGLGALGFHTLLQLKGLPYGSFEAHMLNNEIFRDIKAKALSASQWMAKQFGEPEWCSGYGVRNTHLLAIAPNVSSALLCGGVSQGVDPIVANVYNQLTAAGEIYRINPVFLKLAKERGKFSKDLVDDILANDGSVQHLEWLTDNEKLIFLTAYEINQLDILRLAAGRQPHVCQSQPINSFWDADETEENIMMFHREAFRNEQINGLYYMNTQAGVKASTGECIACAS